MENVTFVAHSNGSNGSPIMEQKPGPDTVQIVQLVIASSGILSNLTVIIVFMKERKMRKKIPNICIINQVRTH